MPLPTSSSASLHVRSAPRERDALQILSTESTITLLTEGAVEDFTSRTITRGKVYGELIKFEVTRYLA